MPELPEVETVKNELLPYVIGHRICGVTLLWEGIVRQPSAPEFCSRINGQEITAINRRGKYLIFSLDGGNQLVIHLKMSGSLLVKLNSAPPGKFTRAVFHLDNGTDIVFRDPRKFGAVWLVEDSSPMLNKLGPEPFDPAFTAEVLARLLARRTAPIKPLLLEQTFIAGIGNMYADEALYAARIHPLRPAGSLTTEEIERLHRAIQDVLSSAIGNKGASIENYIRPDGTPGTAHFQFKVAHQRNKNCPVCGGPIQRIPIRNRGSYFCPACQD